MAYQVHDLYCCIHTPIHAIHLWSYRTSNAKLDSKLMILVFYPLFDIYFSIYCTNKVCNVYVFHCLIYPPRQSIYEVTAHQIQVWSENGRFCVSDPHFDLYFSPYCTNKQVQNLNIAFKVYTLHCLAYSLTHKVHVWSYIRSKAKLASKSINFFSKIHILAIMIPIWGVITPLEIYYFLNNFSLLFL